MLSGVTILCFAASYAVTLVLEVSRLLFRSGVRGALMLGFAGAGLLAHSAFLYYRAVENPGSPLSSERDWYLLAAWALVGVYLYLVYYFPRAAFGLFLLPIVLGLIGAAVLWADPQPYAREPASVVWGTIHGISILLAVVAAAIAFTAGLMYLSQAYRLKHKRLPRPGLRLPSLEWLQRINARAVVVAVLTLGVGVLSGMILNRLRQGPAGETVPWCDPLVLSTQAMFLWLLAALVLAKISNHVRAGRKVVYLTVASFVFLIVALGAGLFLNTEHGGSRRQDEQEGTASNQLQYKLDAQASGSFLKNTSSQAELAGAPLPARGGPA